jgi:uncharacterized membrane-anchored protein
MDRSVGVDSILSDRYYYLSISTGDCVKRTLRVRLLIEHTLLICLWVSLNIIFNILTNSIHTK